VPGTAVGVGDTNIKVPDSVVIRAKKIQQGKRNGKGI
jgi:hypothetical protein